MSQEDFPLLLGNRTSPGGRFTDSWNTVRPIADISLGLCWAKRLKDDYYKIGFKLAWETLLFFNFNQNGPFIAVGVQAPKSGMLALNGVSGKASFDF